MLDPHGPGSERALAVSSLPDSYKHQQAGGEIAGIDQERARPKIVLWDIPLILESRPETRKPAPILGFYSTF
jgi:hypothetical protein